MATTAQTVTAITSHSWSGYQTTGEGFTDVQAKWTIPSEHDCGVTLAFNSNSSAWIGLGGGTGPSNALIQAGSESYCVNGTPHYVVFAEVFPGKILFSAIAHAGDTVSAHVSYPNGSFSIHITDMTISPPLSTDLSPSRFPKPGIRTPMARLSGSTSAPR